MKLDLESEYRQHGSIVERWCRQLLADSVEAEDACQEVFVRVLRNGYPSPIKRTLLRRISVSVCIDKLRTQTRKPARPASDMVARIASLEDPRRRHGAWRTLTALFRTVGRDTSHDLDTICLVAAYSWLYRMSRNDVAKQLGISERQVRKILGQIGTQVALDAQELAS